MPAASLQRAAEAADDPRAQAAKAARQALAAVLRRRAELAQQVDADVARLVDDALARIAQQLAAAPSDYQLWVLPRMMDGVQRVMDELAVQVATKAGDGLRQAVDLGTQLVDGPLLAEQAQAAATAVATGPVLPPAGVAPAAAPSSGLGVAQAAQLRAMRSWNTGLIQGATADTVKAINRALGQVVLGVAQPMDAIRQVAAELPDRTRAQVRGIVNSNLATAFNGAADTRLQEVAARDPGLKKQWRRSGKLHARANHDAADGQLQDVGKPFVLQSGHKPGQVVRLMYPGDPSAPVGETIHCGCVSLPWRASWRMRNAGAKPLTAAEQAARAKAAGKAGAKGASKAPGGPGKAATATTKTFTTQQRILQAFKAADGRVRDVTGQLLVVDERLAPAGIGDARLTKAGQDLYSYNAVQTIRRPTEVWQTERVSGDGELLRERIFLKRFTAAGQQWVGQARFRQDGPAWVPAGPYTAQAAGASADTEMTAARAGARVWPRRV